MILTVKIRITSRNPYLCTTLSTTNPTWMDGPVFEARSGNEISANNRVSLNTASGKSE
jgi:hypothetical protein